MQEDEFRKTIINYCIIYIILQSILNRFTHHGNMIVMLGTYLLIIYYCWQYS